MSETRFPVGGARDAVYAFLREYGFMGSGFSDKHWIRADGLHAHVYGAGSRVRLTKGQELIADGPLEETMKAYANVRPETL